MTTIALNIATKAAEWEIEIEASGHVITGGSNSYGSDEPAWAEVENLELHRPDGRPLPRRLRAALTAADWDRITDAIIDEN